MRNHTILIADDERGIRRYVEQELVAQGFDVVIVEDGVQVMTVLERFVVDVVILDQHMQHSYGLEIARQVRRRHPKVSIILYTADSQFESHPGLEVDAVVMKTADLSSLTATIHKLMTLRDETALIPPTARHAPWVSVEAKCG